MVPLAYDLQVLLWGGLQWSKLHVHADISLKVTYTNKQVFFSGLSWIIKV